jgi:ABC-type nitrate/sulfonate/bicarbonate transport system substrate-binding protein
MILFFLYMFHALPQYVPKATVEFKGRLQEKVVKEIEISNPFSSAVTYTVQMEGSTDFTLGEHTVHLEAKSVKKIPVSFVSRFSRPAEAKLVLVSKRKGTTQQG